LDGAGSLRTVDPRAIHGVVTQMSGDELDPAMGRSIAGKLGAGAFVLGNIVEVGGKLRIDASVYRGDGTDPTEQGTVEGSATEVFDLLDRLATQLVVLDRSGPGATLASLESMTTSSLEALKHYLHGVNAFRSARFQSAADELKMAVADDSTFALAWYQLSATAEWLFDPVLAHDAIRMAALHGDRLSERGRRLVEALETTKAGRNEEALGAYRSILSSYPDDVEAWYQLGELIFHSGPMIGVPPEESLQAWERLLFYEPDQVTALIHMARIWLYAGNPAKVDSVARVIFALEPDADRNAELRAHLAFDRKGRDAIVEAMTDLKGGGDDMLLEIVWSLAVFRDDPGPAMTVASLLAEPTRSNETRALGHLIRAYVQAGLGRISDAYQALDSAAEAGDLSVPEHKAMMAILPFRSITAQQLAAAQGELEKWDASAVPPSGRLSSWYTAHDGIHEHLRQYLLGVIYALRGKPDAAAEAASRLGTIQAPARAGSLPSDLALGVRAEIALREERPEEAERLLEQARRHASYHYSVNSVFFAQSRERFTLAGLLEDRGDYEGAIRSSSFFERHSMFDWPYIAQSHLRRASAYEKSGDFRQAAHHLERFVALWNDCDEEFRPVVDAARARLAELRE
ncbi:MAG TPA: tetratricopeptide repeat protein, partial [Rhodothermia bacterium]